MSVQIIDNESTGNVTYDFNETENTKNTILKGAFLTMGAWSSLMFLPEEPSDLDATSLIRVNQVTSHEKMHPSNSLVSINPENTVIEPHTLEYASSGEEYASKYSYSNTNKGLVSWEAIPNMWNEAENPNEIIKPQIADVQPLSVEKEDEFTLDYDHEHVDFASSVEKLSVPVNIMGSLPVEREDL